MLVHWIWLSTRPGLSDRAKVDIVARYGDPEDVYYADGESLKKIEELSPEGFDALRDKDLHLAQKILAQCADEDIHLLTYGDRAYPDRLKNIPDPPLVLYYKGRLPDFSERPAIGVVGTRKASVYGINVARRMGYQIARCGGIVVTGLAAGVDAAAANGALTAQKPVVGVLGCGLDVVYPASNRELFSNVERQGCLISEYPLGTPPAKWNFPRRNRIISGLSNGVLVVEAPARSGALITARQALEQGRDVFVVPGNIDVESCQGSNALMRDGAMAVTSGWDVLSEYQGMYPDEVQPFEGLPKQIQAPETFTEPPKTKKIIDNGAPPPYIVEKPALALTAEERAIVERLEPGKRSADDLIADIGGAAGKTLAMLTMLEIKGVIRRLPGNILELK